MPGTAAVVRSWSDDEGWGVLDSDQTPGGCWTHFSAVRMDGYRTLTPGQHVHLEWERAEQDGYEFRAVGVVVPGVSMRSSPSGEPPEGDGAPDVQVVTEIF